MKLPPVPEPPPGAGFVTPTAKLPAVVSKVDGIVMVSWVAETNVVLTGVPPNVA